METNELQLKSVRTDSLIEYARNPRKNDAVVDKMVASIKEFGFRIPIVAKSDGSVVDGHLRLKAARKLGMQEVPVVVADDLSEAQIKAFRLLANQSANWAEWDEELLKLELEELKDLNFDLDLTGFDLSEVERLLRNEEIEEDDFSEEEQEESQEIISKVGDLWLLGKHRLLCGDSTKIEDIQKLMNGKVADMIFTDPPYNVKIDSIVNTGKVKHDEFVMASGEMSEQEFVDFLTTVFKNMTSVSKDGSIHYICMDWKHIYEIITAGRNSYTEFKQLCVWNKDKGGMGTFYRSQHELIFVFKNGKAPNTNNFELGQYGRYRTNVWDYAGMNITTQENIELRKLHPTVKPVKLVADAILDCSNHGELILDLFGGSGTTMIACEETDRQCCMMELDPKYVDTIIHRWQQHTGEEAIHAESGKSFNEVA
ncbi:MAG: DNA modification methylase [Alphaproteobacteria bacterium]|nr:DNA modification methylase [Alphaproteobacteria bacterium]